MEILYACVRVYKYFIHLYALRIWKRAEEGRNKLGFFFFPPEQKTRRNKIYTSFVVALCAPCVHGLAAVVESIQGDSFIVIRHHYFDPCPSIEPLNPASPMRRFRATSLSVYLNRR